MSEEKKEKEGGGECRVTVKIDGCEGCGKEIGDLKLDGKQRVIKVVCCPPDEKKEQ